MKIQKRGQILIRPFLTIERKAASAPLMWWLRESGYSKERSWKSLNRPARAGSRETMWSTMGVYLFSV